MLLGEEGHGAIKVDAAQNNIVIHGSDAYVQSARSLLRSIEADPNARWRAAVEPDVRELKGMITAVSDKGLVELSVGQDDGVRKGDEFEAFRRGPEGESWWVARVRVQAVNPDRSVARVGVSSQQQPQQGDQVVLTRPAAAPVERALAVVPVTAGDPDQLALAVKQLFGPDKVECVVDPRANILIVRGTAHVVDEGAQAERDLSAGVGRPERLEAGHT